MDAIKLVFVPAPELEPYPGIKPRAKGIVPRNSAFSFRAEESGHAIEHPCLEAGKVVEPEAFQTGVARRAFFPSLLGRFVATEMEPGPRKKLRKLFQHSLKELESGFLSRAQELRLDADVVPDRVRAARASQPWI